MSGIDVRTQPGDVHEINGLQLLYGDRGIELTLTRRNMTTVRRAIETGEQLKDGDSKDRRFLVSYDKALDSLRFEPLKGEVVTTPRWMLVEDLKIAA